MASRSAHNMAMMRVEQVMSGCAFACRASDDAAVAAAIMWDHDCGAVPVVDDAARLVGIVTDRDLCMAAYTRGQPLHGMSVSSVMQTNVHSCRASDSVAHVESLMTAHHVRRIPVVDGAGRPVGMVSLIDLARQAARVGPGMPQRIQEVVRALVALCERQQRSANAA
jgi:CBS domain-containing protein